MGSFSRDINTLLKIKYKHNGRTPEEGLDCLTFVLYYFNMLDSYDKLDIIAYDDDWWKKKESCNIYYRGLLKNCKKVIITKNNPITKLNINSIIGFSLYNETDKITHVGIYIGDNKIIHCCKNKGVIISTLPARDKIKIVGEI